MIGSAATNTSDTCARYSAVKDRWQMRSMLPPLAEPDDQRVITKEGERGTLEGITTIGTHAAYIVALDSGESRTVYATDLDLDTPDQAGA